jgi:choline kinase
MRALILAAGRGTRMGAIGDVRPKCLVELGGRLLLERQVAALRAGGAAEIGVVRGYRADMLEIPGIRAFTNARWSETNMVMSLATAAEWLRAGPVIVSYADIFYRGSLIRGLEGAAGDLVITYDRKWRDLWSRRFTDPLADAETFRRSPRGKLLEIGGKTTRIEQIEGQYMGLLKLTPRAWNAVEALLATLEPTVRDKCDMTSLLKRLLVTHSIEIATHGTDGEWGEIDNPSDVALYEAMVGAGELTLEPAERLAIPGRG